MFLNIFGTVVEIKQMSTKDRLERKKYMGVWRWESELTSRMISRFPNRVIRYMERKIANMRGRGDLLFNFFFVKPDRGDEILISVVWPDEQS